MAETTDFGTFTIDQLIEMTSHDDPARMRREAQAWQSVRQVLTRQVQQLKSNGGTLAANWRRSEAGDRFMSTLDDVRHLLAKAEVVAESNANAWTAIADRAAMVQTKLAEIKRGAPPHQADQLGRDVVREAEKVYSQHAVKLDLPPEYKGPQNHAATDVPGGPPLPGSPAWPPSSGPGPVVGGPEPVPAPRIPPGPDVPPPPVTPIDPGPVDPGPIVVGPMPVPAPTPVAPPAIPVPAPAPPPGAVNPPLLPLPPVVPSPVVGGTPRYPVNPVRTPNPARTPTAPGIVGARPTVGGATPGGTTKNPGRSTGTVGSRPAATSAGSSRSGAQARSASGGVGQAAAGRGKTAASPGGGNPAASSGRGKTAASPGRGNSAAAPGLSPVRAGKSGSSKKEREPESGEGTEDLLWTVEQAGTGLVAPDTDTTTAQGDPGPHVGGRP